MRLKRRQMVCVHRLRPFQSSTCILLCSQFVFARIYVMASTVSPVRVSHHSFLPSSMSNSSSSRPKRAMDNHPVMKAQQAISKEVSFLWADTPFHSEANSLKNFVPADERPESRSDYLPRPTIHPGRLPARSMHEANANFRAARLGLTPITEDPSAAHPSTPTGVTVVCGSILLCFLGVTPSSSPIVTTKSLGGPHQSLPPRHTCRASKQQTLFGHDP